MGEDGQVPQPRKEKGPPIPLRPQVPEPASPNSPEDPTSPKKVQLFQKKPIDKKQGVLSRLTHVVPIVVTAVMFLYVGYRVLVHPWQPQVFEGDHCPVCLETNGDMDEANTSRVVCPCRHVLCQPCFDGVLAARPRCPECRVRIPFDYRPLSPEQFFEAEDTFANRWAAKMRAIFNGHQIIPNIVAHITGHVVLDVILRMLSSGTFFGPFLSVFDFRLEPVGYQFNFLISRNCLGVGGGAEGWAVVAIS